MKRRSYSREFKVQAVKMVTEQGLSVSEVSRDLGVSASVIGNWNRKLADEGELAFPGNGRLPANQEELRRIRHRSSWWPWAPASSKLLVKIKFSSLLFGT